MKISVPVIVLAGVAGCATEPPSAWVKPGGTQQVFAADRYECMQKSAIPPTWNPTMGTMETTNSDLFSACMGAHGWRWQRQR